MIENPDTSRAPSPTLGDDAEALIRRLAGMQINMVNCSKKNKPGLTEYAGQLSGILIEARQILADHDDE